MCEDDVDLEYQMRALVSRKLRVDSQTLLVCWLSFVLLELIPFLAKLESPFTGMVIMDFNHGGISRMQRTERPIDKP
jgi:hypothetical protein